MNTDSSLQTARARIADCLQLDEQGQLVQRRDSLNLAGLGLTDAELTASFDVPERGLKDIGLASLCHLRYLDLTGNQLTELPDCVTGFTRLVWLGLNFNRIAWLPEEIGALTNLQRLYLRGNGISQLPGAMGNLQALRELDLTGCGIAAIPSSMANLRVLEHIVLEAEALRPDLRAVWKKKNWKTLREHLTREAKEVSVTQFVGKVVLVGPQENGKTCLQRALRGEKFVKGYKSTDGMSRERLHLGLDGKFVSPSQRAKTPGPREDVIDLTLWDMGGQKSYQHTHQMFFTPSAVYLVVTLPRRGGSVQKIDEWIDLVKRRTGDKAVVIVVSTCCREKNCAPDEAVTLAGLQARHGEMVRALVAVDSKYGTGIPELRKLLVEVVREPQAQCRQTWLPGWAKVLDALANSRKAFLRWSSIEAVCGKCGVKKSEEQRQVIRMGHYIGALMWREDIPAGEDVVILNPDWLCRAVARLLDDEETRKAHGLVEIPQLERLWSVKGRDGTPGYKPNTYPALIELMEINELAYRPKVPGKKIGEGHLLLVTQMVEDKPKDDVDKTWQAISPKDGAETVRVVGFRKVDGFGYEAVPDIIYLLIFRLREFSLGRTDYKKWLHWQRGLLVTDDYGSAGKIELDGPLLRITVRHELEPGLMHSIAQRIGVRDDGFWNGRGLEKVDFVPCGQLCREPNKHKGEGLVSMESCLKAKRAKNSSVECQTCHEFLPIQDLLNQRAVESEETVQLRQWLDQRLRALEVGQGDLLVEIQKRGAETQARLAQLSDLVRMQGDGILDTFTSEWKDGPRLFSLIPILGKGWKPKTWTQMEFRVTVWCEASRRPVPLFGELKKGSDTELKGSETITLTRDWVQSVGRALTWCSWATLALASGGAAGISGLVTATGGIIEAQEAKDLAAEIARQQKVMKEVSSAIPDESKNLLQGKADSVESIGYGRLEDDLKLIRFLREEFKKKDPTWGGLVSRDDGKFSRIWAHPKSEVG
ncbi:MAG: hypothetical protein HZC54_17485 [Verrucomicrobia bacterium]|nr:hypothetical protein [Verrucomicrobiota bacterium]